MLKLNPDACGLIHGLEAVILGHLNWTRRLYRYVILGGVTPEVIQADTLACDGQLGEWLLTNKAQLLTVDADSFRQLESCYRELQNYAKTVVLSRGCIQAEILDGFDQQQDKLMSLLSHFKTELIILQSIKDPLTGLAMRHLLPRVFLQMKRATQAYGGVLYLLMLDLDHFKSVNDKYGHSVGDQVLQQLAERLLKQLNSRENLFRYGGEEFLMLLLLDDPAQVAIRAESILDSLRNQPFELSSGICLSLTLTIGAVEVGYDDELSSMIALADKALYQGKKHGRNCWQLSGRE
ncbi:MAG: sensor domain-containing diguanylate cyclase [Shewanella indica]|jgi:diguanylate cyclase (GGDEF)-like protein|uniref:sensor domain-containing diguanylate cyclase n=1 Tax=Shewanella indica TaxID=768528 RepID=UPI0030055664